MRKKKVIDDLFEGATIKAVSGKPLFSNMVPNATINPRKAKHNMDESLSNYFIEDRPLFEYRYGQTYDGSLEYGINHPESLERNEVYGYNEEKNYAIEQAPYFLLFYIDENGKTHYMDRRTGNPKGKGENKEIKISDAELSPGKCKTIKTALELLSRIIYSRAAKKLFTTGTVLGIKRCYRYKDIKGIIKRPKANFSSPDLYLGFNTATIREFLDFVDSCYEYKKECRKRGLRDELTYEDRDLIRKGMHYMVQWTVPTNKDFNLGLNIEFNEKMDIVPSGQGVKPKEEEKEAKVKVFAKERKVHKEKGYKRRRFDPELDIRNWEFSLVRYDLPHNLSEFPLSEKRIREILSEVQICYKNKPVILYQNEFGSWRVEKFGKIGEIPNILNFRKGGEALVKRSMPKSNSLPTLLSNFNSFMKSGKYKKLPNWKEGECSFLIAEFEKVDQ